MTLPYVNDEIFALHIEHVLVPPLAKGDSVILDNLGRPQGQGRSPCDPQRWRSHALPAAHRSDLNPVEQLFARLRHWMRSTQARIIAATWQKLGDLLLIVSRDEACSSHRKSTNTLDGQHTRPQEISQKATKNRPFGAAANVSENGSGADVLSIFLPVIS